jgi:hypothetical protein
MCPGRLDNSASPGGTGFSLALAGDWRLALCAIKWVRKNSLDFFSQMVYPTLDGS